MEQLRAVIGGWYLKLGALPMVQRASVFAVVFWLVSGTLCSAAARTIYEGLTTHSEKDLSTFVDSMKKVFSDQDLKRLFDGESRFTIFAPNNAAFAELFSALSDEELEELEDLNSGLLEKLLRYHITRGKWRKPTGALRMLDDNVAQTYREGGHLKIDEATIERRTRYQNGIIATIDTVISPPQEPLPVGPSVTVTSHKNDLDFDTSQSISGTFGAHSVSSKQPYGPVSFQGNNVLEINAGRHQSSGPAQFFMNGLSSSNVLVSTGDASRPSGLNFAQVVTTLNIEVGGVTFTCDNVRFGQGSQSDGSNNWWVGQPGAEKSESLSITLACTPTSANCKLVFQQEDVPRAFNVSSNCG